MSELTIWNLALGHLGEEANISAPNEASFEAEKCRQFYPLVRDQLLESHEWNFATRREVLAEVVSPAPTARWPFAYAWPSGAIAVWRVGNPDALPAIDHTADARRLAPDWPTHDLGGQTGVEPFEIEIDANGDRVILSGVAGAEARYTARVTDPTKFSPAFATALSWLLASYLAGPILKGDLGRNQSREMLREFRLALGNAAVSDSNQKRGADFQGAHRPGWIRGR